jgi:hypothetical protein
LASNVGKNLRPYICGAISTRCIGSSAIHAGPKRGAQPGTAVGRGR